MLRSEFFSKMYLPINVRSHGDTCIMSDDIGNVYILLRSVPDLKRVKLYVYDSNTYKRIGRHAFLVYGFNLDNYLFSTEYLSSAQWKDNKSELITMQELVIVCPTLRFAISESWRGGGAYSYTFDAEGISITGMTGRLDLRFKNSDTGENKLYIHSSDRVYVNNVALSGLSVQPFFLADFFYISSKQAYILRLVTESHTDCIIGIDLEGIIYEIFEQGTANEKWVKRQRLTWG